MITRIDLFMPPVGQYGALSHFTKKLYEALTRSGVNCRLLEAEKQNPKPFLTKLFSSPPDCTLSFNGLLPDDEGRFFCDMIKIPHVACLVDSPVHFFPLVKSPYNVITCVDQNATDFFKSMNHSHSFFMPHGVEKNLIFDPDGKRNYDVLFPASYIDYETIEKEWESKYPDILRNALHEAAEKAQSIPDLSYINALVNVLEEVVRREPSFNLAKLDFITLLDELEMYLRGLNRVKLVRSIKTPQIDIFGRGHQEEVWRRHLGADYNLRIHDAVDYEEALELMRHSKIVLNSCAWIKNGGHERIFAALACGALPLTAETPYLKETFTSGENILFSDPTGKENDSNIMAFLKEEPKRQAIAKAGREVVMQHHTWDHRAKRLIQQLAPCLQAMKGS